MPRQPDGKRRRAVTSKWRHLQRKMFSAYPDDSKGVKGGRIGENWLIRHGAQARGSSAAWHRGGMAALPSGYRAWLRGAIIWRRVSRLTSLTDGIAVLPLRFPPLPAHTFHPHCTTATTSIWTACGRRRARPQTVLWGVAAGLALGVAAVGGEDKRKDVALQQASRWRRGGGGGISFCRHQRGGCACGSGTSASLRGENHQARAAERRDRAAKTTGWRHRAWRHLRRRASLW